MCNLSFATSPDTAKKSYIMDPIYLNVYTLFNTYIESRSAMNKISIYHFIASFKRMRSNMLEHLLRSCLHMHVKAATDISPAICVDYQLNDT